MTGELHMESRMRWIKTPQVREANLMSRRRREIAPKMSRKRRVWANVLPMFGLPNSSRPKGLSMISGRMDPRARNRRSSRLYRRAVARARPTWAKRSIG